MSTRVTFDTHTDNFRQGTLQEELFTDLELLLLELLAHPGVDGGATLLDETLVVVCTEMGRTPLQNPEGGKDHWPWASAMLFGAGLRTGAVFGATDDAFQGMPVDRATGQPSATGRIIDHGQLAAGILSGLGLDPEAWLPGIEPFDAFVAPRSGA